MRIVVFFLVFATLMGNSCRKNPPTAQYYFKCKVDGQEYIPNGCANCLTCSILGDTTFLLGANRGFEALAIGIIKLDRTQITTANYLLNDNLQQKGTYKNSTTTNDKFETDATRTGYLNINSLDKTNNIISGTFQFQGYNPIQDKTVNITNGEFRLKYTTY